LLCEERNKTTALGWKTFFKGWAELVGGTRRRCRVGLEHQKKGDFFPFSVGKLQSCRLFT
jgi:hypothetical protein